MEQFEIERGVWVSHITLAELVDRMSVKASLLFSRPPRYLNETLYDYCEWMRFNEYVGQMELKKVQSEGFFMVEDWSELLHYHGNKEVYFYDYYNQIIYMDFL